MLSSLGYGARTSGETFLPAPRQTAEVYPQSQSIGVIMHIRYNPPDYAGPTRAKYDPVPEGNYLLRVVDITERKPRNGGSPYLSATLEVLGGPDAGRLMFDSFSIDVESERGRNFARRRLNALARRADLAVLGDLNSP
jgi:hypothetical protein